MRLHPRDFTVLLTMIVLIIIGGVLALFKANPLVIVFVFGLTMGMPLAMMVVSYFEHEDNVNEQP